MGGGGGELWGRYGLRRLAAPGTVHPLGRVRAPHCGWRAHPETGNGRWQSRLKPGRMIGCSEAGTSNDTNRTTHSTRQRSARPPVPGRGDIEWARQLQEQRG